MCSHAHVQWQQNAMTRKWTREEIKWISPGFYTSTRFSVKSFAILWHEIYVNVWRHERESFSRWHQAGEHKQSTRQNGSNNSNRQKKKFERNDWRNEGESWRADGLMSNRMAWMRWHSGIIQRNKFPIEFASIIHRWNILNFSYRVRACISAFSLSLTHSLIEFIRSSRKLIPPNVVCKPSRALPLLYSSQNIGMCRVCFRF